MKQRYIEFPSTWDELTETDWRELLRLRQRVLTTDHAWTATDVRAESVRLLLANRGVKVSPANRRSMELTARLADTLDWLWPVDADGRTGLSYRHTANLLPRVGQWQGPASHGQDLAFGEFRQAFAHLVAIENEKHEADFREGALCALAGLLYRPAGPDGRRTPFDAETTAEHVKRGHAMKPWQRWGIYAWFAFFCEYLTSGTFIIDGRELSFAPIFTHDGQQTDTQKSQVGELAQVSFTMAETGVFGTLRDVDHTPLLQVLLKLLADYERLRRTPRR